MKNRIFTVLGAALVVIGLGVIVAAGILLLDVNRHEKHAEKASGEVMSLLRPMLAPEEETEQTPVDDAESVLRYSSRSLFAQVVVTV